MLREGHGSWLKKKRHRCIEQSFGLYGRGWGWDDLGKWHWNMYTIMSELWVMVMDREAWRAAIHGVPKSWTWLSMHAAATKVRLRLKCIEPGLAIHFIHDTQVSMPFFHIIPSLSSPTESKRLFYTSVSLLLSRIQGYHYHLSKFHRYVLVYCIGVFLSGLLHSV